MKLGESPQAQEDNSMIKWVTAQNMEKYVRDIKLNGSLMCGLSPKNPGGSVLNHLGISTCKSGKSIKTGTALKCIWRKQAMKIDFNILNAQLKASGFFFPILFIKSQFLIAAWTRVLKRNVFSASWSSLQESCIFHMNQARQLASTYRILLLL